MNAEPDAPRAQAGRRLRRTELPEYLREKHGINLGYQTLNKYGSVGGGPPFVKFGNQTLYDPEAVDRWVADRMSTPCPSSPRKRKAA